MMTGNSPIRLRMKSQGVLEINLMSQDERMEGSRSFGAWESAAARDRGKRAIIRSNEE